MASQKELTAPKEAQSEKVERERVLDASLKIGQTLLSTLDLDRILDDLGEQVVKAGLFRSLTTALVRREQNSVDILRRWGTDEKTGRRKNLPMFLRRDLDSEDIMAETVRSGQLGVIEGWDDKRFTGDAQPPKDRRVGQVAYFIPVKRGDQVLAVLATGSTVEEREAVLLRIEQIQPLLDQIATALDHAHLYGQVRQQIAEREKAEASLRDEYNWREAEHAVRLQIASMDHPRDLCRVVEEISTQLKKLAVDHDACAIQIVNEDGSDFVSVTTYIHDEWYDEIMDFVQTGRREGQPSNTDFHPWIVEVWKSGQPRYVGCETISGRGETFVDLSIIDVPFSHGTLAINKSQVNAFQQSDIDTLQRFANAISDGFQRFLDIVKRLRAEELIQSSLREKEVLLKEIHHRVKNNLQTISSLLSLQAANIDDADIREKFHESENRIRSMALIHETLYQSSDLGRINLAEYIPKLAHNVYYSCRLDSAPVRLDVQVAEIHCEIDPVISCALIINELVTNAMKYAFPMGEAGTITVALERDAPESVVLHIFDDGVGMDADIAIDRATTLGLRIVSSLVRQLRGRAELESTNGTHWTIYFPLP